MYGQTPATLPGASPPEFASTLRHYHAVFARKWWVFAASQGACLALAAFYVVATRPLYEANARLLLLQQGGRPLSVARDDGVKNLERSEDFIPTQMAVLQSPRVVGRAIEAVGHGAVPTLRAGRRNGTTQDLAHLAVKDYLKVTRPDRTASIILVRYRAGSKAEAVRFVDALLSSYDEFIKDHYHLNNSRVVSLIVKARDDLKRELDGLQDRYLAFQREHPLLLDDEAGRPLNNSRLGELDRAANESMVKAMKLRSQRELVKKLARDGAEMWSVAYAIAQLGGDPAGALLPRAPEPGQGASGDYLRQLHKDRQELSALYGPEYSKVKDLQEQIASVKVRSRGDDGRLDQEGLSHLLSSIEKSLESVESMGVEIGAKLQGGVEKAKQNAIALSQGKSLRENLERQQVLFYTIVDQLKQAQFGGDFGGVNTQAIEQAHALDRAVHPQTLLILLGAVAVGCVSGAVAALVADGLDNRVHTLDDLRKAPSSPVLGVIPKFADEGLAAVGGAGLASFALPRSPLAEAYKVLRTNLEFLRRERPLKVLLVTSAVSGEGKTTTSSNLAISLALAGRKVLLVDADLRKPQLHEVYGRPGGVGLVQVLRDGLSYHEALQTTPVDGLDLITTGGQAANPAELLMSPRMPAFLDEVRGKYDFVVVDSSPLLPVTDPAVIGASVDGIVLVLRASVTRCQHLTRAADLLRDVGTPILGTVITGSDPQFSGHPYGYGSYGSYGGADAGPVPRPLPAGPSPRTSTEVVRSFVLQVANDPTISSSLDGSASRVPR